MPLTQEPVFPKVFSEGHIAPLRKQRAVTGGHVADEGGHLRGEIELVGDLGVTFLQLNEVLLELVVAEQRVLIVGGVVDDPASELRGGGANAQGQDERKEQNFSFHRTLILSFLPSRDRKAFYDLSNRATRDRPRDRL